MTLNAKGEKLRIGVIGTSRFTQQFHLDSLKNHPNVQIAAICGRNRPRAEAAAATYGIPLVFTDYRELIASPQVDAVVVVTPNNMHHPIAMATLEAGKHILCEKPLAMDLKQAREMYEKAEAAGVVHMVNFTFRGVPASIRMRELIREGYIGDLYHIHVTFMSPNRRGGLMEWRRDPVQAGTGALGDLGAHVVDQARWLAGDIVRVCGHLSTAERTLRTPETGQTVPNETDDACALVAEFENGAHGIISASWVAHPGMGGMEMGIQVHGSDGMLRAEYKRAVDPESWVRLKGAKGSSTREEVLPLPGYLTESLDLSSEAALVRSLSTSRWFATQRFVEAVMGNAEPSGTFYDGMKVQGVLDAVVRSSRGGGWVSLT